MTAPRWYRGLPLWVQGAAVWLLVGAAFAVALWFVWRVEIGKAEARGRAAAVAEGEALWAKRDSTWARTSDSLAALARRRDTVLVPRIARARAVAAATVVLADSAQPSGIAGTLPLPSDTLPTAPAVALRACGAQLDSLATECERFREAATAALAAKDSALARSNADGLAVSVMARDAIGQLMKEQHKNARDTERHRVLSGLAFVVGVGLGLTLKH